MRKLDLRVVMLMIAAGLMAPALKSAAAESCPMMGSGGGCCAQGEMVAAADEKAAPAAEKDDAAKADVKKADDYPLDVCPVTGEKLGKMGKPYIYNYKGREVRFCCSGCVKKFEKDPASYIKKMDAAIIKKEKASYPLTTCVVSGDKLGEMGEPIDYVARNNHLVRLCCNGCVKKMDKDAKPYLKKLDEAKKAAAKKAAPGEDAKAEVKKS